MEISKNKPGQKSLSSLVEPIGAINFRHGQWSINVQESRSSNFKELSNLVELLEKHVVSSDQPLNDTEIFLFTDNSVAEYAYYKGNSTNELLFNLVLRLRKLEHTHDIILHVIHIAGTRMIQTGIDGLSRGNTLEGIMGGKSFLEFIPLHLTAFSRSDPLRKWFERDERW